MAITGANARKVKILSSSDWATWGEVITGAGTIVESGTNNVRVTIDNVDATRTFKSEGYTVDNTKWYVWSVDVISCAAAFDTVNDDCTMNITTAPASGDQSYAITSADVGNRVGIKFKPSASGALTFRIGVGTSSNREAGEVVFENVQVQEFDEDPSNIDIFYDSPTAGEEVYTNYIAASTLSSNVVTEVVPTQTFQLHPFAIMAFMGDSFGNDSGEFPERLKVATDVNARTTEYYNGHVAGERLDQIGTRINGVMTGSSLPPSMLPIFTRPQVVVLQGGINDVIADATSATMLSRLDTNIDNAIASGASDIFIINVGPFGNSGSWSSGRQAVVDEYNAALGGNYRGYKVYDMYSALEGDANPDDLSDTLNGDTYDYNSGDDLHPNTGAGSGSDRVGIDLAAMIQEEYGSWFDRGGLYPIIGPNGSAPRVWGYHSANNALSTINNSGYFDNAATLLGSYDILMIRDSDNVMAISYVTSNSGGIVDIADGLTITSTDTD